MTFRVVTRTPEETDRLGQTLGGLLWAGDVLLLQGQLGAGKTLLTQGIAKGMGISEYVTSPTFILANQYDGPLTLYHIDLYRIEATAEAIDLGLDDYFYGEGVCVVEWPERAMSAMPLEYLLVTLEHLDENERSLTFHPRGPRYEELSAELESAWRSSGPAATGRRST